VRQIKAFNDPALTRRLAAVWGPAPVASGAAGEADSTAKWRSRLTPQVLARADLGKGRELFQARCAACHKLNGEGGALGPDLTGAARDNLAYLLENILTSGATVADDYRLTTVTLTDGRVLAGVVRERAANSLTLQSVAGPTTVALGDVAKQETSPLSPMPPGLIDDLTNVQARDLVGYLMKRD
jgi:putative heme-binding domain-containing protein